MAIRAIRISQDDDMQSHSSVQSTPQPSRSPSPENFPAHVLYEPYSGGSNSPSSFGGFIFTPGYSSDGWEPLRLAPISVDTLTAGFQGLSLSTMQPTLPSQQDTAMLEAPGSPEACPVQPRGADHGGGESGSLPAISRLPTAPGLTAEELESQERMSVMGSSVEEGSEAGEIRPVDENGVEYIDLTLSPHTGDLQAGDHPGPPWQLGGHARVSMDIQDRAGQWSPAKYIRCDIINDEPMVYGTMGVDHLEFGEPLKASPFIGPLQCEPVEGGYTEFSNANYFERAAA